MAKERPKDLSFYEWRFPMWRTSPTRDMLDAAGRGIYRELLDQCYAQGEFPDDPDYICRVCACSRDEFERAWKVIEKHFPKRKNGARFNKKADLSRREYAAYIQSQRDRRGKGIRKSQEIKEIDDGGSTMVDSRTDLTRTRTRTRTQQGNENDKETAVEPRSQQRDALSITLTESEPGFWTERMYGRHPKKSGLVLVSPEVLKIFQCGGVDELRVIDAIHEQKCLSEKWRREPQFVPALAKWLQDRGWTEPEAEPSSPVQHSKFAAAFDAFDERDRQRAKNRID